ncbi:MAG: beta-propeller domain-containing protein [Polyangiaceae bacterium]|nr:beta-propeller domain-containing protein [Polyangiaceae bacterium]
MAIGPQPTRLLLCAELACAGLAVVVASCGSTATTSSSQGATSLDDSTNTEVSNGIGSETAARSTAETAARTRPPVDPLIMEEGDIVKAAEHRLYILNQHAGLNVIDTSSPKAPERIGRLSELAGTSGELYLRDNALIALVVDSGLSCHALAPERYRGLPSTAIALVAHPALDPIVVAQRCVPGALAESRLVGDMLYVATSGAPAQPGLGFVFSLDTSGADSLDVVDDVTLEGSAFEVHVTDSTLYLAEQRGATTSLRILDISAGDGSLAERGSVQVAGTPAGRFHMDARGTEFRLVTRDRDADTSHLYVIDVSNPDHPAVEGTLERLAPGEELFATRFVEDRAYVVTYQPTVVVEEVEQVVGHDPLWVISLEDPEAPRVVGRLEIPGWSDFIFPRGDELFTVGRGEGGDQVAATLLDVSDPTQPTELARAEFGTSGASSEASADFRAVSFIEEDLGSPPLVVVPYSNNQWDGPDCVADHHVQLLEVGARSLTAAGSLEQDARVLRALPVSGQLYAVTTRSVVPSDVSDRQTPVSGRIVSTAEMTERDACLLAPPEPQRVVTEVVAVRGSGNDMLFSDSGAGQGCSIEAGASGPPWSAATWLCACAALMAARPSRRRTRGTAATPARRSYPDELTR